MLTVNQRVHRSPRDTRDQRHSMRRTQLSLQRRSTPGRRRGRSRGDARGINDSWSPRRFSESKRQPTNGTHFQSRSQTWQQDASSRIRSRHEGRPVQLLAKADAGGVAAPRPHISFALGVERSLNAGFSNDRRRRHHRSRRHRCGHHRRRRNRRHHHRRHCDDLHVDGLHSRS